VALEISQQLEREDEERRKRREERDKALARHLQVSEKGVTVFHFVVSTTNMSLLLY